MESIIKAQNVVFKYNGEDSEKAGKTVLDNISLEIPAGEFVAVLGHNGSGKSTLAKHFNALLLPQSGSVTVCGYNTSDEENVFNIRKNVGMVFQNPDNQLVATIVEEDVAFGPENLGVAPDEIRQRVDEALKAVDMYDYRLHAPHKLSGGQKQRVAIAGVIAMQPQCIVLDEPTAMLDPKGRKEVMETVLKLNREHGITIVLITHYMEEAALADRVIVMDDGKVVMDDTPKKVFSKVDYLKSISLDVPQAAELAHALKKNGFKIGRQIVNEQEFVDAFVKYMGED